MTGKELEKAKIKAREENCITKTGKLSNTQRELICRDMINSILCYNSLDYPVIESRYMQDYINELGEEKVKELIKEQRADFLNAIVLKDVFIDGEGLTYNRIVWADDDDYEKIKENIA